MSYLIGLYEEFHKKYNRIPNLNDPKLLYEVERRKALSKYKVLDYPLMAPGRCVCCGSLKPDRKYIDFDLSVDGYGAIYFCTRGLREIFDVLNIKVPGNKDVEIFKNFKQEIVTATDMIETFYADVIKQINNVSGVITNAAVIADLDSDRNTINTKHRADDDDDGTAPSEGSDDEDSTETESGIDESDSKPGSENVFDITELLSRGTK